MKINEFNQVVILRINNYLNVKSKWREWTSGLRCCSTNRKIPHSDPTALVARSGIGTQLRYEAPVNLQVENVKRSD